MLLRQISGQNIFTMELFESMDPKKLSGCAKQFLVHVS